MLLEMIFRLVLGLACAYGAHPYNGDLANIASQCPESDRYALAPLNSAVGVLWGCNPIRGLPVKQQPELAICLEKAFSRVVVSRTCWECIAEFVDNGMGGRADCLITTTQGSWRRSMCIRKVARVLNTSCFARPRTDWFSRLR